MEAKSSRKDNENEIGSANGPATTSLLEPNSASLDKIRSVTTYTHSYNSSTSIAPKLPISELKAVIFARLDIDWSQADYISQVINAQNTKLCAYDTARRTSEATESAATKSASEKTQLLRKLASQTEALRKELDDLVRKHDTTCQALPSSQGILGSTLTAYPGYHTFNLKDVHRLPPDTIENHISMYGDFQLKLISAIITTSKKIAETKHQQAYKTPTTIMAFEEKKIQKSDTALLATKSGENSPWHDPFTDLLGLMNSKTRKLVTTPMRMFPQVTTAALERTSTGVTDVAEFRDKFQPLPQTTISTHVAYKSLLDEDHQECSVSRPRSQLEGLVTRL